MNDFTKEKLAFVIGLLAILFTLSPLIESVGQIGFSLFGFVFTISHVYYFIAISLLIAVYFYGIRFITEKFIRITESIGNYLYIIAILAPPIYMALFLVVGLANVLGKIFQSDSTRFGIEIVMSILVGVLSSFIAGRIVKIFTKKEKVSSVQQLQKKESLFFSRAESLFNSGNYDLSVVESLKAIEIAAQKYLIDHGHIPYRKTNYSWIKILDEKKLVPHEMIENLLFVKDQRNLAAHAIEPISYDKAKEVLFITSKFLALMSSINSCPVCGSMAVKVGVEREEGNEIQKVFCEDCGWEETRL
jgi:HEPN domain-containing protein